MNSRVFATCAVMILSAATASGQNCIGLASLGTYSMNATVSGTFSDGSKGVTARYGGGTTKAFGGVSGSIVKVDGVSGTTKGASVDGGLIYPVGEKKRVSLCPVAQIGYDRTPTFDDGEGKYYASATLGSAGVAVGGLLANSSSVGLMPFAILQAVYAHNSITANSISRSSNDTYGVLSGGLSFVFSPTLLVRPTVSIPIGLDGAKAQFGAGVSFAFGKR